MGTFGTQTFIGLSEGEWTALGAVLGGLASLGLLVFAWFQLRGTIELGRSNQRLQRELLESEVRPYVVANLESRNVLAILSVTNIGKTPAFSVVVKLDGRFHSAAMGEPDWQDSPLFTTGIPMMAPAYQIRFALDSLPQRRDRDLEPILSGSISYQDRRGVAFSGERFIVDLSAPGKGLRPDNTIHDLVGRIDTLNSTLGQWGKEGRGLRVNTVDHDRAANREIRPMHFTKANEARLEGGLGAWIMYWVNEWRSRLGIHEW